MMKSPHHPILTLLSPAILSLCLLFPGGRALADEVVFYRCTDAAGALTLQNMPCPKGQQQQKKVMQSVTTVPMGVASTPAATASAVSPPDTPAAAPAVSGDAATTPPSGIISAEPAPAPIADKDRLPPPVLFQCITHDKDSYITESDEPQSRCVTLQTVGLDGNPQTGAGEACEMMRDTCARVADGALCEAWKKRIGETEVAWRFARPENAAKNQAEFERVKKIVAQSQCGASP